MSITVLLVDDNALFRDGIAQILQTDGRFQVIGHASSGEDALNAVEQLQPALVLMDLEMPGMGGVEAIRAIRKRNQATAIGVLTMFETSEYVEAAMNAGASGYVAKDSAAGDFCQAAAALARGERDLITIPADPAFDGPPAAPGAALASLTARELGVLRALATGASTETIARSLSISPKTLRNHISRTYRKLGIYDRAQAVIVAVREGLIDVGR